MSSKRIAKKAPVAAPAHFKPKARTIHLGFVPRNDKQVALVDSFSNDHILLAIGVAGTGKTYCMVTLALQALLYGEVNKIIITRPIVEAGEKLGFLPGDIRDKTEPYNAPVIDIIIDHIGREIFEQFILDNKIQIIPLAYSRGRTYNDAMMILDEAQNATIGQTHMFLTRMGENSKVLVTGDPTQIDLPYSQPSGLMHAIGILRDVEGVGVIEFNEKDVQRHFMVSRVAEAYAKAHFKPVQTATLGIIPETTPVVKETTVITDPRVPKSKKEAKKKKAA